MYSIFRPHVTVYLETVQLQFAPSMSSVSPSELFPAENFDTRHFNNINTISQNGS